MSLTHRYWPRHVTRSLENPLEAADGGVRARISSLGEERCQAAGLPSMMAEDQLKEMLGKEDQGKKPSL